MIVVSDTSPVRGLIAIGQISLLQQLFSEIFIRLLLKRELLRIEFLKTEIAAFLRYDWVHVKPIEHHKEYNAFSKLR